MHILVVINLAKDYGNRVVLCAPVTKLVKLLLYLRKSKITRLPSKLFHLLNDDLLFIMVVQFIVR